MRQITIIALACALSISPVPVLAQQTTGTIAGRIVDDQEAGIAGTAVTARSAGTGFTRTAMTDDNGFYRLNALPVGAYQVTAERTGLTRFERDGIVVNIARTTDLHVVLRVPAVAETITSRRRHR